MGKITSIYLTDEEAIQLKKFCDENQCTKYSALKIAVKELLSKPIEETQEETPIAEEDEPTQQDYEDAESTEQNKRTEERKRGLQQILKTLQSKPN